MWGLSHPSLVIWDITHQCNLSCYYCRNRQFAGTPHTLSSEQISEVVSQLHAASVRTVNVSGGEPLLSPNLDYILEAISAQGMAIVCTTNGHFLSTERLTRLAALGVERLHVSIDGDKDTNDSVRGSGSFAAALAGAKRALGAGIHVRIMTTVSKSTVAALPRLAEILLEAGFSEWTIRRSVPASLCGESGESTSGQSGAELRWRIASFAREVQSVSGLSVVAGCDPLACFMSSSGDAATGGCGAGSAFCYLAPNGDVYPCSLMPLLLGNVFEAPLDSIWLHSETLGLLRRRESLGGRCGACHLRGVCGGCRAEAHAEAGDYLAADPTCWLGMRFPLGSTGQLEASGQASTEQHGVLSGVPASRGRYAGSARVLTHEREWASVMQGDVLVTTMTNPTLAPVLPRIGALVTDQGGMLSHAAIVAREYGVPSVVGTSEATQRIPSGAVVCVDGSAGIVAW